MQKASHPHEGRIYHTNPHHTLVGVLYHNGIVPRLNLVYDIVFKLVQIERNHSRLYLARC